MNISYGDPLDRAYRRMKLALLHPFDLGKWLVLGFTAWLAALSDGGGAGGGDSNFRISEKISHRDFSDWYGADIDSLREFVAFGLSGFLIGFLILAGLALLILVIWLSSRGKFMFLDNLVHNRAEVRRPWGEYRREGNDLFVWNLVYALVSIVITVSLVLTAVLVFVPMAALEAGALLFVPAVILAGTFGFMIVIAMAYFWFFLEHFVVTIMYRERIGVTAAWSRFLILFRQRPGSFVLYGLAYLLLMIVGSLIYLVGGILTCCVGLILLMIPYIGAVLVLPLTTLARYWDLEFLGQYGDDYNVLDELPPPGGELPSPPYASPPPAGPPEPDSAELDGDGTVVGPEDVGEDGGGDEPRQERP